jgi:FKBP-type peptidyl-prolyl cis-trans isomerase FkpA
MKRKLMFFALATMGLASCNGFKKGDSGMLYKIITDKPGPSIKEGDFVSLNFIIKNDADSVLANSYESGHSQQLVEKIQQKGDVFSGLSFLSEGDSAIIKMDIDSTSKGHPKPPGFKGKYVTYIIKVDKVISKGNLSDQVFNGRINDFMKTITDAAKKAEPVAIKKYIADNNLKVTQTASGLSYVITKQGSGPMPAVGDTVLITYIGKNINGKVFDTNIKAEAQKAKLQINPANPYKPLRYQIGSAGMIKGLVEGLPLLNTGAKATFILPSDLGYGEHGSGPIQPFSPMVFDIELVGIVHPNPNAPKPVAQMPPPQQQQQQQQPAKK